MWSFQGLEVFVHNNPKTDAKGVMRMQHRIARQK